MGLLCLISSLRLIQRLLRLNALAVEPLTAPVIHTVQLQIAFSLAFLRSRRGERRLRLPDLFTRLRLLVFQLCLGLRYLRRRPSFSVDVIRLIGA